MNTDGTKRCPRCGETKVAEGNFYRVRSQRGDGFGGYCIPCVKVKVVEWQKANPEKKAASDHRHYVSSPDRQRKVRERLDRWRRENPEKAKVVAREGCKRWVARHPEQRAAIDARRSRSPEGRASQKRWREKPAVREKHKLHERERRKMLKYQVLDNAGRAGALVTAFTLADWSEVIRRFDSRCAYCRLPRKLEMDHVVPFVKLGVAAHARGNIVPACRSCNASKSDGDLAAFCARRGTSASEILALAAL